MHQCPTDQVWHSLSSDRPHKHRPMRRAPAPAEAAGGEPSKDRLGASTRYPSSLHAFRYLPKLRACSSWLEVPAATAISAAPRSVRKRGDFPGPLYLPARRSLATLARQRSIPLDDFTTRGAKSTCTAGFDSGYTGQQESRITNIARMKSECEINTCIGLIPDTASTGSSRKDPAGISRRGAGMGPGEANLSETTYGEFQCYTSGRVPGQLAQARHALRPHLPVNASRAM